MNKNNTIVNIAKTTIYILVAFFVGAIVIVGISKATLQMEEDECMKWQQYAKEYPSFYLTSWQKEQCDRHHIDIDARIDDTQKVY